MWTSWVLSQTDGGWILPQFLPLFLYIISSITTFMLFYCISSLCVPLSLLSSCTLVPLHNCLCRWLRICYLAPQFFVALISVVVALLLLHLSFFDKHPMSCTMLKGVASTDVLLGSFVVSTQERRKRVPVVRWYCFSAHFWLCFFLHPLIVWM